MINWRTVVGLIFLLGGMVKMYTVLSGKIMGTPIYSEIGCIIWMLVGVFLIIKGMTGKAE